MKSASDKPSPPSAHDVARLAGVSQAAVSRAFTPGASIAERTRSNVLKAAKELGYRPNLVARSLLTGKSELVGVVMDNPRNPVFLETLDHLSQGLSKAGLHLLVFTQRMEQDPGEIIEALLSFRVDVLIVLSSTFPLTAAARSQAEGVRVIFLNQATTRPGFASVSGSNYAGGRAIAEHMLAQGYTRFAYVAAFAQSATDDERGRGFAEAVVAAGLPAPIVECGRSDRGESAAIARKLLSATPRPDAIFCANDIMALATVEVARNEFGLTLGTDIGVAGFDDIEGAYWPSFSLTTYAQPIEATAARAVELVTHPWPPGEAPRIIVDGQLRVRWSTQRQAIAS